MTSSTETVHQGSNPPTLSEETQAGEGLSHPRGRLHRLQILLLVVLGLWFVDTDRTDRPALASSPAQVAEARPVVRVEELSEMLRDVNPLLDPAEGDRIARAVIRYSGKYELDPELVTAVLLVESSARPGVRSPKGAVGLMQVMPHMMAPLGLVGNAATIESNIEAGCWILADNIRRLGEDAGISSYFWGSNIRGLAYLERVRAAREEIHRYRS